MNRKRQTYRQIIMAHLMSGKSITNMEAYNRYAMTSAIRRISELRADGVLIQDEFIKQNGKRFKRYWVNADSEQLRGSKP